MKSARKHLHWLFSAYATHCKNQELTETLDSGSTLITNNLLLFKNSIEQVYSEIKTIVSGENVERMLTIREENEEEESYSSDPILRTLNRSIADIRYLDRRFLEVIQLYKEELKRLATDLYKWDKRNKELKAKLKKQEEGDQNVQSSKNQEKKPWDSLNKKIESLKRSLKTYEEEIKQKDAEIVRLKSESKESSKDDVKALKRNLTTLRGEKSLMISQYQGLKKLLSNKQQVATIQDEQIHKLKLQIEYLSNSLEQSSQKVTFLESENKTLKSKNHSLESQLQMLKSSMSIYVQECPKEELEHLQVENKHLFKNLEESQRKITLITNQFQELEESFQEVIVKEKRRNQEMELIVAERNETIVRLKNVQPEEKYEYYVQLVKLLTKKVMDRDLIIEQLKSN